MKNKDGQSPVYKLNIILSIVLAFVAWVFVVYNYSPMKDVTYSNVPIEYVGEEELVQRGLGIQKSTADYVDVTLSINRIDYNSISAEDISVTADVSEVIEGVNGISLDVTPPAECDLVRVSTKTVSVEVGAGANKDVDITPVYGDSADSGIEPVATQMSYRRVSVLGAEENVARVKSAAVKLSTKDLTDGEKMFIIDPVALDENGREVPHIVVLPGEISLRAVSGTTKKVPLSVVTRDESGDSSRHVDYPDSIYIKGTDKDLEGIDSINAVTIDISRVNENTEIPLTFELPDGVYIARRSLGAVLSVTVK